MNNYDEELQRFIENGGVPNGNDPDARIYHDLFKSLSTPPVDDIPYNFADRVLAKVLAQREQRSTRDFIWLGVGVFMLLIVCIIGFAYSGLTIEISNLRQLGGIGGLVLFAIAFCALLSIVDKKVVTGKFDSNW